MKKKNGSFIFHIHPEQIPVSAIRYTYTFGLGGMALVLVLLQVITGVLLKFVYDPSPERAYDSILFIQQSVLFGQFIRNIHHISGILLIFVSLFHLFRVFFTGAFYGPRRSNWIIGVVAFLVILFANFTGYLLPWDQLSYWAVTVVTQMLEYIPLIGHSLVVFVRGGEEVGAATLLIFFNFHTAILPLTLGILLLFHFWKVRRAGGVLLSRNRKTEEKGMVPVVPNLVVRELTTGLVLLAVVFILAVIFNAPLKEPANPAYTLNPAKAPWYFLGIQELIMHFHPFVAVVILPLVFLFLLFYLPFFPMEQNNPGIWFDSALGWKLVLISSMVALVFHPLAIVAGEYILHFESWFQILPPIISEGFLPLILYVLFLSAFLFFLVRKYHPSNRELIQAVFAYFIVTYTVLSLTAIFFRGAGMSLVWPWNMN